MAGKQTPQDQLHTRLGEETARQVDRYIAHMKKATGLEYSRADACLSLIRRALVSWDAEGVDVVQKGRKS